MNNSASMEGALAIVHRGWERLDPRYRNAFIIACGVGVFTYFLFFAHQILGNHSMRIPWLIEDGHMGNGRWLGRWLGYLHYNADVPVIMQALGLLFGVSAAWLAVREWRLLERGSEIALLLVFIIVFPFNLAHFYYTWITPLLFLSWLFAAAAVAVVDRATPLRIAAGCVLVLLMMATYQTALSILSVLIVSCAISRLIDPANGEGDQGKSLRPVLMVFGARIAATVIGGGLYFLSLQLYTVDTSRGVEFDGLAGVVERLLYVAELAVTHLWISQPDMIPPVKILLLALFAAAVIASLFLARRSPARMVLLIALWCGLVLATKALLLIYEPDAGNFEYRYNTSLIFFHAFTVAVLLSVFRTGLANAVVAVVAVGLSLTFIQADLVRQLVLLRGQQHDLAFTNRVLTRMESLPELIVGRSYDLITVGQYSNYRWNLYRAGNWRIDRAGDGHMDFGVISDHWVDEDVYRLLGSSIRFQQTQTDPRSRVKAREVIDSGLLDGREPWPAPSSVFIDGDRIILYFQRPSAPPPPPAPVVQPAHGRLIQEAQLTGELDPTRWRGINGGPSSLTLTEAGIEFSAGRGGISTDGLIVRPGEQIRQVFSGRVIEPGWAGVGIPFPVGPVILNERGEVAAWWSGEAGARAAAEAGPDGFFEAERVLTIPEGGTAAHMAFNGPWLPGQLNLAGRIRIESVRLERVVDDSPEE